MIFLVVFAVFCLGALEARPSLPINGQLNIFNPPDKRAISLAEFILQNPNLNIFNPPDKRAISLAEFILQNPNLNIFNPPDKRAISLAEFILQNPNLNIFNPPDKRAISLAEFILQNPPLNVFNPPNKREVSEDVQDIVLTEPLKDLLLNPLFFTSKKSVQPVFNFNWTKILEELPLVVSRKSEVSGDVQDIVLTEPLKDLLLNPLFFTSKKSVQPVLNINWTKLLEELPLVVSRKSENIKKAVIDWNSLPQIPLLLSKKSERDVIDWKNIILPELPLLLSKKSERDVIDWKNIILPELPLLLSKKSERDKSERDVIDWKNIILPQLEDILSRNSEASKRSNVDWASLLLPQTALVS
ncbi:unnamed protein product [Lymnaea stagnalis]|uniref:Uncharacterized protein n=1 Tax=Lymnaea stagnalis TaxID=6523 RepID=A0AAV2I159_LYMST